MQTIFVRQHRPHGQVRHDLGLLTRRTGSSPRNFFDTCLNSCPAGYIPFSPIGHLERLRSEQTLRDGIEHRVTRPSHSWSHEDQKTVPQIVFLRNVKRFHYDGHDQLRTYLADFMAACNFARRLKILGGLTSCEYICKIRKDSS